MMRSTIGAFSAVALMVAAAVVFHPTPVLAQGKTQKISKNLIKRAEDMVKDLQKARKQADKTAKKYDEMFTKKNVKSRQKTYKDLNKEIKKTEDRVKDVRKRAENMQKEADKFFNEWSKGLTKIKDTELRGYSHENMVENRDRYTAVIEAGLKSGGLYDGFATDLTNQCAYFELDMSDSAMAKLTTNREDTRQKAKQLFQSADELSRSTKQYIESMK
jgi:peptidoglycan hydrolase CwlO-like protein